MEELFLLLFEFLWEIALQFLLELLLDAGIQLTRATVRPATGTSWNLMLSSAGQLFCGAAAGGLTYLLLPQRLFPPVTLPGISIVLSPLGTGALMYLFGGWVRNRGGSPSSLATFRGGALFAFACAATRFLLISSQL
jgi:hypothetical protein